MKWCVSFPEESVLVVRPCLNTICAGVKPAAKLLSVLLYRYSIRQEHKEDADNINEAKTSKGEEPNQDATFRIYRKQSQLITDMCGEITEKTLHDVAVPTLQLLGFLDVDESSPIHCYDVHRDIVEGAMQALKQGSKQLEKFLIVHIQLEKFLIDIQLEKLLINKKYFQFNKKYFQLALEKVLIANRNTSNNKRGRKPSSQASSEGVSEDPQINIEISNKITEEDNEEREIPPNILDTHTIVSSDTTHAFPSEDEYPLITFADCLNYLQEQGVAPRGEDAVQIMVQARTLYAHKHPRYEYRARPGLSEHPDDQLPSKQSEELFIDEEQRDTLRVLQEAGIVPLETPQGDTHATLPASGHPHRVGEPATRGGDSDHTAVDNGQVATPKTGPVLEAQEEINEKGQTDDGNQSRASSSHPDGSGQHMRVSGNSGSRDLGQAHQETLTQIPPTSMPAQSLSSPQAEQAAPGARARTRKPAQPKAETPKSSPVEPPADMAWGTRKCLLWFDYWRGGILIGKWKLMQASTCAKGLAEQFDEQTVIQARDDMEADPYYAAKGGCDVCDVANNIHKYLKRRERQHLQLVAAIPTPAPLPRIATKEELRRIPV